MATLNPYLNFNGKTEEAFNFYKSVFGGDFSHLMRFKDMPPSEEGPDKLPKEYENYILHVSLPIGDSDLMGSDCIEEFGQKAIFGSSNYVSVTPKSEEETRHIFKELSAGGEIEMPLEEMFWGDLFASFSDKFGIKWMLNYPIEK
ncbi:VOC family protein [Salegentibacter salegens]|uniref:PhnB protein n=1 Tax=Salegentibacter salegens TaxID=143223 RepID=A0A1M7J5V4_9FLAO|nr:VOC family protein [Salegentibacter salegens]PRX47348.1 PhnB protein [Salegentibacter salegens]SHM48365.1 PhnB protein [Salegentibacter salegens]